MKLYIHLIYLLGLLCFWEMVIQPGSDRHDSRQIRHEMLNSVNINQIDDANNELLAAIIKASFDYPSRSADEYAARADNALDCFEDARNRLADLKSNDFNLFRTENDVLIRQLTDNYEYVAKSGVLMRGNGQLKTLEKMMSLDYPSVKNDFKVRLAMATLLTENYCASKNGGGGCRFDRFFPLLIADYQYVTVGKKVNIGAAISAFSSKEFYLNMPGVPPLKDGIGGLDTLFERPGIYTIPLRYWFRKERSRAFEHAEDTLTFEVFPK